MKFVVPLLFTAVLSGCASVPYEELNLDTTSNISSPSKGKAGIYVYQWKRGPLGAISDVDFEINGETKISLNTGEYGYFEIEPGDYKYKLAGGLFPQQLPVHFSDNENYFFRAYILQFTDHSVLIREQSEIDAIKKNITGGRYELYSVD
jgi:hypothetical protein